MHRLNYTDGRYSDAQDVTISTANFGSLSSLADLTPFVPISNETNFIEYLVQRGYIIDENLRAAPFDWRLGASMQLYCIINFVCTILLVRSRCVISIELLVKLLIARSG